MYYGLDFMADYDPLYCLDLYHQIVIVNFVVTSFYLWLRFSIIFCFLHSLYFPKLDFQTASAVSVCWLAHIYQDM